MLTRTTQQNLPPIVCIHIIVSSNNGEPNTKNKDDDEANGGKKFTSAENIPIIPSIKFHLACFRFIGSLDAAIYTISLLGAKFPFHVPL